MHIKRIVLIAAVITITTIFILLSILHFYWALGGTYWYDEVLPTSSNGLNSLNPSATATILIAFGLMFLALITVGNLGVFDSYIKRKYFSLGILIIAIVFLLRAIGDFKFIGFFKTIKGTTFATNDGQFFSPLCLFISLLSIIIFVFTSNKSSQQRQTQNVVSTN